jgi:hypothetical protein
MKKLILALFAVAAIFSTQTLKAQIGDSVKWDGLFKRQLAGAAQIQVTYRNYDMGQLNHILNNNGIPSLSNNDIWINASMMHVHGNWLFEDGLGFTPITSSNIDNLYAKFNQYQLYARAAYNFSASPQIRLFPFAGANFSLAVLDIQDKNRLETTSDFSTELLNTTSSKTFYQPNFGIELGGGMDYLFKVKDKNMGCFMVQRNIPLGLRVGYYINAAQGDWKVDSYSLQNGPDKKQNAVFVSLNIGLGYEIKKE